MQCLYYLYLRLYRAEASAPMRSLLDHSCAHLPTDPADFFKVVCQHISRTSNQLAAEAEAGRAAATTPSQPAVLACELDELEMVLSNLCSALATASYYSPTTMQLIAKEVGRVLKLISHTSVRHTNIDWAPLMLLLAGLPT